MKHCQELSKAVLYTLEDTVLRQYGQGQSTLLQCSQNGDQDHKKGSQDD